MSYVLHDCTSASKKKEVVTCRMGLPYSYPAWLLYPPSHRKELLMGNITASRAELLYNADQLGGHAPVEFEP